MTSDLPPSTTAPDLRFDRDQLLHRWLQASPDPVPKRFTITLLSEVAGTRKAASKPLVETLFIHHNDPEIVRKKLARLGYSKVADALDRRPKSHNTRLGNFGEVIASEFLRELRGYEIPVYRLRYNTNDESSPKGDDVLAFEFAGKGRGTRDSVIVAEVKVRSEFQSKAVEDAHDALRKGFRPRPKSFAFVIDILFREGREDDAFRLLDLSHKFGKRSLTKRSCLFLITGNEPQDPFGCLVGRRLAPGLETVQLTLDELPQFVNELFEAEVDINAI
jgi:Cap4 SAVED domain